MDSITEIYKIHKNCTRVCCAGFWQKEHFLESFDNSFSNEVHPLFHEDRFKSYEHGAFDPEVILMGRRFASRIELNESPENLTGAEIADVKERLELLTTHVTFQLCADDPDHNTATLAYTRPSVLVPDPPFFGRRCTIYFPLEMFVNLERGLNSDSVYKARGIFQFGLTPAHEMAHAARMASRPGYPNDNYFLWQRHSG